MNGDARATLGSAMTWLAVLTTVLVVVVLLVGGVLVVVPIVVVFMANRGWLC